MISRVLHEHYMKIFRIWGNNIQFTSIQYTGNCGFFMTIY